MALKEGKPAASGTAGSEVENSQLQDEAGASATPINVVVNNSPQPPSRLLTRRDLLFLTGGATGGVVFGPKIKAAGMTLEAVARYFGFMPSSRPAAGKVETQGHVLPSEGNPNDKRVIELFNLLETSRRKNEELTRQLADVQGENGNLKEENSRLKDSLTATEKSKKEALKRANDLAAAGLIFATQATIEKDAVTGTSHFISEILHWPQKVKEQALSMVVGKILPSEQELAKREQGAVNQVNETLQKWIIPLGEAAQALSGAVMPIAIKLDDAISRTEFFLGKLKFNSLDQAADLVQSVNSHIPTRPLTGLEDYLRDSSIKALGELPSNNAETMEKLVGNLNVGMQRIDKWLSTPYNFILDAVKNNITDPLFGEVQELIGKMSEYLLSELDPLIKEAQEIQERRQLSKISMDILANSELIAKIGDGIDLGEVSPRNMPAMAEMLKGRIQEFLEKHPKVIEDSGHGSGNQTRTK